MKSTPLLLALTLAGCAAARGPLATAATSASPDWHGVATDDDQQRLRGWRDAWTRTVAAVRAAGEGAKLDADPALFDLDRALDHAAPPPGEYRCRWIKLGSSAKQVAPFTRYPAEPCRVAVKGKLLRFRFLDGAQRPHGMIFPDEPTATFSSARSSFRTRLGRSTMAATRSATWRAMSGESATTAGG